ncbi:hypothetical protein HYALB_00009721 [Hymenoscyphus albidus]|uniref:Uncharacterized protein n=1 Tax=Hymenoscyphus albidus TaxID=595503 RepID=A0A9N9PT60_9HELO|nr:hypothetical protein HYALB_00009721 [Hymenoscyphus albidus]
MAKKKRSRGTNNSEVTKWEPLRNIVREWKEYFGNESNLQNWQRLCGDLDIVGDLSSKTKSQALEGIWVNIWDFLDDVKSGVPVRKFRSQASLAEYTISTQRIYPKKEAKKQGPVRALLAHIF